jgi:hypothetical protein
VVLIHRSLTNDSVDLWINGTKFLSYSFPGTADLSLQPLWIGDHFNVPNRTWTGRLLELLIYDAELTVEEVANVSDYLARHWQCGAGGSTTARTAQATMMAATTPRTMTTAATAETTTGSSRSEATAGFSSTTLRTIITTATAVNDANQQSDETLAIAVGAGLGGVCLAALLGAGLVLLCRRRKNSGSVAAPATDLAQMSSRSSESNYGALSVSPPAGITGHYVSVSASNPPDYHVGQIDL